LTPAPAPATPLLRIEKLAKIYLSGDKELVVFRDLDLEVPAGQQVAIIGESGAGKSTLLHLISGLDRASAGSIYYRDRNITELPDAEMASFRNREIGYVWQQHHLLPEFTAEENVSMPLVIRGESRGQAARRAREVLKEVGLGARLDHRPGELSGGEQQRVAIARALAPQPAILLADEPTGNLDERTGEAIFDLLTSAGQRRGLTTILVTHNLHFAGRSDRIFRMEGGVLRQV
jgi:lipoprotein-releasing system ATP-binding protein